jgi:hypothetical protein
MNAGRMWLQILLDVVSYENEHVADGQLLSQGADRLVEKSPVFGRILILGTGAIVTLHLANVLEDKYDLMSQRFWNHLLRRGLV